MTRFAAVCAVAVLTAVAPDPRPYAILGAPSLGGPIMMRIPFGHGPFRIGLACLCAASAAAQVRFGEPSKQQLPIDGARTSSLQVGDLDGGYTVLVAGVIVGFVLACMLAMRA